MKSFEQRELLEFADVMGKIGACTVILTIDMDLSQMYVFTS